MFKSWRLGTVFGFPIEINMSFLLLLGLVFVAFGGFVGVMIVTMAFASVLLHELGHALVARQLGVGISGIELGFLGGAAKMVGMPRRANHEIAIAAAGPAVSLALAGAGLGLGALLHVPLLATIGWINLVLAGFNLIPALPMDGGRILRAVLAKHTSYTRATDLSVTVARVVAVGFGLLGLMGAYQLLLLAPFLWIMGTREQLLARMVEDHYGGYPGDAGRGRPVEVMGQDPWSPGPGRGAWRNAWDDGSDDGARPGHRYRVERRNGRLVIVAID